MTIEVLEPGMLTSVQDPIGRSDWRHLGVPVGGAADPWSARLANRLVGNDDAAALLEMTIVGATLRFSAAATIAVTGGLEARRDGVRLPGDTALRLAPGAIVAIGSGSGARGYLAVAGGLAVPHVLGSPSTDLRTGFGGLGGRALRAGDRLGISAAPPASRLRWTGARVAGPIRIVAGPHADRTTPNALTTAEWVVSGEADRTGIRLDGQRLNVAVTEVSSMGLPLGAIQIPADGRPIVMLADRPVTGGYPVPAVVIEADLGRMAQQRPGDRLRFASISIEEALTARRRAEDELGALVPAKLGDDDELGWAGSLE